MLILPLTCPINNLFCGETELSALSSFSGDSSIRVTIVTPVYNQASTLAETIESVLNQSYQNIEYIIVNDGSTDNTAEVLDAYSDRVRIITQNNAGQAAALNLAWGLASGEYFTYLSADDIIYPHCIETLVKSIDGQTLVYYPDYDLIDVQSCKIRTKVMPEYNLRDLICGLICQPGLVAIFRADVFRLTGGWDKTYQFIPDFEFWARVSNLGKFKRVPYSLGGFRIHDESGSVRSINLTASDEIIRFVDEFEYPSFNHCKRGASFKARLMSARSHLQSGRFYFGIIRYIESFKVDSRSAIKLTNIIFVLNGLFKSMYYRIRRSFILRP